MNDLRDNFRKSVVSKLLTSVEVLQDLSTMWKKIFFVALSLYCFTAEAAPPVASGSGQGEDEDPLASATSLYTTLLDAKKFLIEDVCTGLVENGNHLYTQVQLDSGYDLYRYGDFDRNPNVNLPRTNLEWFAPKASRYAQDYQFARIAQANCNATLKIFQQALLRTLQVRDCVTGKSSPYVLMFSLDPYVTARVFFSQAFISHIKDLELMKNLVKNDIYKKAPMFVGAANNILKTTEARASMYMSIAKILEANFPDYLRLKDSCVNLVKKAKTVAEKLALLDLNWHAAATDNSQLKGPIVGFVKAFKLADKLNLKSVSKYEDLDNVLLGLRESDEVDPGDEDSLLRNARSVGYSQALPEFALCPRQEKPSSYDKDRSFSGCGFYELVKNDKPLKKQIKAAIKKRKIEMEEEQKAKRLKAGALSDSDTEPEENNNEKG